MLKLKKLNALGSKILESERERFGSIINFVSKTNMFDFFWDVSRKTKANDLEITLVWHYYEQLPLADCVQQNELDCRKVSAVEHNIMKKYNYKLHNFERRHWELSLSKVWNENERFSLVFMKMLFSCPKLGLCIRALSPYLKSLRRPGINSEDSIPPAYLAWQAGTKIGLSYRPARLGIGSWAP